MLYPSAISFEVEAIEDVHFVVKLQSFQLSLKTIARLPQHKMKKKLKKRYLGGNRKQNKTKIVM